MIKKGIVLTATLALLFGLSSCSNSQIKDVKISDYKTEVSFEEYHKWEDKFNSMKLNKDYTITGSNKSTRTYDLLEDDVVIETFKAESIDKSEIKNDYDNKMITQKSTSNSNSETKNNSGVEKSKSNSADESFAQYYNDKFYKFDKDDKSVLQMINYDIYAISLVQITGMVKEDTFDKFYIDNDVYTAVNEEENVKVIIQCTFKNDSFTFAYVIEENNNQELNSGKVKKEKINNQLQMNFNFKDLELTPYTDLSEYKFN